MSKTSHPIWAASLLFAVLYSHSRELLSIVPSLSHGKRFSVVVLHVSLLSSIPTRKALAMQVHTYTRNELVQSLDQTIRNIAQISYATCFSLSMPYKQTCFEVGPNHYCRGKTEVTADRDKIEFRLFNSSSIFNITLREELLI